MDFYLGQSVAIHVVAIAVAGEWRFPCTRWTIDDPLDTVGAVIGTRITPVADRTVRVFDRLDETVLPVRIHGGSRLRSGTGQSIAGVVAVTRGQAVRIDVFSAIALDVVVVLSALAVRIVVVAMYSSA